MLQYVEASLANATKHRSLFHSLLNSFAHTPLGALDRRAVPFESAFDFSRQRWFARGHELHKLLFARKQHARVFLFFVGLFCLVGAFVVLFVLFFLAVGALG